MPDLAILHLGDLHYASASTSYLDDDKAEVPAALRDSAFRNLRTLLKHVLSERSFDVVGIVGDITTAGKEAGFDLFESDTAPLLKEIVPENRAICFVPAGS